MVLDCLTAAARRGAAVLVVTHEVEAFEGLADRVVGMTPAAWARRPSRPPIPPRSLRIPPPPGEPLLALEGLHFAYRPGEPVLRGAGLSVAPGETLALTGPSGCGKTTLARCALRLLDPEAGSVRFDGTDITELSEREPAPAAPRPADGLPGPAGFAEPAAQGAPGAGPARRRAARRRRPATRSTSTAFPASSRAASASGWRSPAPWRPTPS